MGMFVPDFMDTSIKTKESSRFPCKIFTIDSSLYFDSGSGDDGCLVTGQRTGSTNAQ